jgi:hypothetical protein
LDDVELEVGVEICASDLARAFFRCPPPIAGLQTLPFTRVSADRLLRTKYARCPPILLPLAYVRRVVRGAPRWFAR